MFCPNKINPTNSHLKAQMGMKPSPPYNFNSLFQADDDSEIHFDDSDSRDADDDSEIDLMTVTGMGMIALKYILMTSQRQ